MKSKLKLKLIYIETTLGSEVYWQYEKFIHNA